ncbi:MAG: phage regulatory CII family protein [Arcobacter sp.]|uniref:phage regulatory CII family protein n=1 Tax=Arcobacter sp. TaxID=1872629 RepID=UPI003C73BB0B
MASKYGNNKRQKEHGLLVTINKSIVADIKRNDIDRGQFANEIGTTGGVLANKLDRQNITNDFSITELIHIMEITGDYGPLKYLCEMFGFVMTSSESGESITIDQLNELTDEAQIEQAESFSTNKKAFKDGKITNEEKENMLKEGMEAMEAVKRQLDALKLIKTTEEEE